MVGPQTSTHTFKVAGGVPLTIDISKPPNAPENGITVLHFHGGFLVGLWIPLRYDTCTGH